MKKILIIPALILLASCSLDNDSCGCYKVITDAYGNEEAKYQIETHKCVGLEPGELKFVNEVVNYRLDCE